MIDESTRRTFVEDVRRKNEDDFGPSARQTVQKLLAAVLPHPWMYVYELTQNALDAEARRVYWKSNDETVLFQHDGRVPLNESHVKGIASLGASTKGLATVGFMGVGFKSVFARFRVARVSGFGWRFAFRVATNTGDFGSKIPEWFDTLCPVWDEEALEPDDGYTTVFALEEPAEKAKSPRNDIERLASSHDPTPLAILALRGLEQVRVDDAVWDLSVKDGVVKVTCASHDKTWQWKTFVSRYRPNDAAMRRFLEVRQETQDQVDSSGRRVKREVIALLPLDDDGIPKPPNRGKVYATLPTQVRVPFGFHLQADWFVNIERQNVRDVTGDPWQQSIVDQVPELVRQILVWLSKQSDATERGYAALRDPRKGDGPLAKPFSNLRKHLRSKLDDLSIIPVHGVGRRRFCSPSVVARMPRQFHKNLGHRATWRPELLFGRDLMDENLLGKRGMGFSRWLGWKRKLAFDDVVWGETVPMWWDALPDDERHDALFALWDSVREHKWDDAPVVPTDSGSWVTASQIVWLNEEPPTEKEPSGKVVAEALAGQLPKPDERVAEILRSRVNKESHPGTQWLKSQHQEVKLAEVVKCACDTAENSSDLPLVAIFEWALHRGELRRDLVPLVLTEAGARKPNEALLADPLVDGGASRRVLFGDIPAIVDGYGKTIHDIGAVVRFLERLSVKGGGELEGVTNRFAQHQSAEVARRLEIDENKVKDANIGGYTVFDYELPFDISVALHGAVQDWLSREHNALQGKGRLFARSHYHTHQTTRGQALAAWVVALQDSPWVLCTDEKRRKPGDVLPEANPDFEDVPIANIDTELVDRLKGEGVRFGVGLSKSPVLRRLARRGSDDMPDIELAALIREAKQQVDDGSAEPNNLKESLKCVRIRGCFPLDRVVEQAGAGTKLRSDLNWVIPLTELDSELSDVLQSLNHGFPATTTGSQALGFLRSIWERQPKRLDELGRHIAAAYRYILDDSESDETLSTEWRKSREEVRLFGGRSWRPLGPNLAVDDVQSPLIRGFLSDDKVIVTSAHLGDSRDQVQRVAKALNLNLLSEDVSVQPGKQILEPPWSRRLRALVKILASLEGRQEIGNIFFHDTLSLHVEGKSHDICAYIDDGFFRLVGDPSNFATEAAGQLVDYFQLGQRGAEVAWLTGALFSLENQEGFVRNIRVLLDGLGLDPGNLTHIDDNGQPESDEELGNENSPVAASRVDSKRKPGTGFGSSSDSAHTRGDNKRRPVGVADKAKRTSAAGRAMDQVRLVLVHRGDVHDGDVGEGQTGQSDKKSDRKARQEVIDYEKKHGRQASAMADNQPGFDVLSIDPDNGCCRRIEVKGVQGKFEGEASVLMTARQVHDAIRNDDKNIEYWLYVVDSTETDSPRVFRIPWTRHRSDIRYGFYASAWVHDAE